MVARRYEISFRVLNYFVSERSEQVKYFSAREEKFRISLILQVAINTQTFSLY